MNNNFWKPVRTAGQSLDLEGASLWVPAPAVPRQGIAPGAAGEQPRSLLHHHLGLPLDGLRRPLGRERSAGAGARLLPERGAATCQSMRPFNLAGLGQPRREAVLPGRQAPPPSWGGASRGWGGGVSLAQNSACAQPESPRNSQSPGHFFFQGNKRDGTGEGHAPSK